MASGRGEAGMSVPTVLAVDDHDETLDLIEGALAGHGYKFFRARSGPDAIGLLMSTRIDVVILDLDMPEMNGIAVLEVIRYIPRLMRLKVIVQASPPDLHNVKRARHLGARAVLEKPLSPDRVLHELQSVLAAAEELALVGSP
jgi:two-component system, chemotaxis family, chemotaxis protein CheY